MRTIVPEQLSNLGSDALLFLKNPKIISMKQLLLLLAVALFSVGVSAQENRMIAAPVNVQDVGTFITSHQARGTAATFSMGKDVDELIHQVQPSVYFNSGTVKTYGEKPRNLFTDMASLGGLENPGILKNNIEIVIVKIAQSGELNLPIDLALFSNYKNLKYVYIVSNVNATQQDFMRMIRNNEDKYKIFYKVQTGE